jgi:3-isopropylmalate/(R)-2-methylmalate dehydratase large subunit
MAELQRPLGLKADEGVNVRRSLFEKIWQANLVQAETPEEPALLYVSLHLLHEISSPQAFAFLEAKGLKVRRPDLTLAMVDHCAPTAKNGDGSFMFKDKETAAQIEAFEIYCRRHAVRCYNLDHPDQGIVHAVAPELGLSRPGQVIVCGDSHTSTHGAFGAIAFGIGSSEVAEVLATQCILQRRPRNLRIQIDGALRQGVYAKDLALHVISRLGALGGRGYAIEYMGSTIASLAMEGRLTLCNMTIEAGARFGLIAPDAVTWQYLRERDQPILGPTDVDAGLFSDADADWDESLIVDAAEVRPMMSWGTNPAMSIPVGAMIPAPRSASEQHALTYMGWESEGVAVGRRVDEVFIGSCTNGRISDLRAAAELLKGQVIAPHLVCLVVPASRRIKAEAEAEGLDRIFRNSGAIWGEPSCSLCNAMNGDLVSPGNICVSTSNRNFEGRQGPRSRTILVSPVTAAAIAIRGHL